jgi:hypothetical protein
MTGLSDKTFRKHTGKAEEIINADLDENDDIVGGDGIEVQRDSSKFGRRMYNQGHHIEGVWVIDGVKITEDRKMFLELVENRPEEILFKVIAKHVN